MSNIPINSTPHREQFYAVFIPGQSPTPEKELGSGDASESPLVFREMKEALEAIKKYKEKSPRFKNFSKYDEALRYCREGNGVDSASNSETVDDGDIFVQRPPTPRPLPAPPAEELPRPFPAPTAPDLTKFRKAIESKNIDKVMEFVNANPRYLINCNGDTPTILHAGCRYNALHVASRVGHLETVRTVLELFKNDNSYVRQLYPDDKDDEATSNRRRVLLDFYLNTPDYGFNETPLHFASKNGFADIVEYLSSFPECQRNLVNKSEQTAMDLVNESDRVSQKMKATIMKFLEYGAPSHYIALYRARDNSSAPILRRASPGYPSDRLELDSDKDSKSTEYKLAAYIGPVAADVAEKIYSEWSSNQCSPPPSNKGKKKGAKKCQAAKDAVLTNPASVKRSDLHKGMERIGRQVALKNDYPWMEYWGFFCAFADLRTENGLKQLERYFNRKDDIEKSVQERFSEQSERDKCRRKLNFDGDDDEECSRDSADLYFDATDDADLLKAPANRSSASNSPRRPFFTDEDTRGGYSTPPEELTGDVIIGKEPTKLDLDVYAALMNVKIDEDRFPRTAAWFRMVENYTDEERHRWVPLDSPRSTSSQKKKAVISKY